MSLGKVQIFSLFTALFLALSMISADISEARRGGSFGSRGTRTFDTVPATRTAPNATTPVERSMTPSRGPTSPGMQPAAAAQRPGLFGGAGGLLRGLAIGGLIGMLLGSGFGGLAGALGFLLQAALLAVGVYFLMSWLRSRRNPAMASGPQRAAGFDFGRGTLNREADRQPASQAATAPISSFGWRGASASMNFQPTQADLEVFERHLADVQEAFANEDHAALRRLCTPEIISYFSEELADNAKRGVRNEVRDTRLLQADIAEAWREGEEDYASAAFHYESIDILRDRNTGAIVEGEEKPTETSEIWTFVRRRGEDWKLSAIQEA